VAGGLLAAGIAGPALVPATALAHERREVGPYTFVVGFIVEPAIQGEPNGIDLRVTNTASGQPVEGVERTLKASIAFGGGQPKELPLRARFQMPGAYTADLIPTRAGGSVFTFSGTIDGQTINERFESGPGRFNDVTSASDLQFPEAVPAASSLATQVRQAEERAAAAEARASQAQSLGIGGVVAGLVGLAAGGAGLLAARRAGGGQPRPVIAGESGASS
jgi:hypothetical protein